MEREREVTGVNRRCDGGHIERYTEDKVEHSVHLSTHRSGFYRDVTQMLTPHSRSTSPLFPIPSPRRAQVSRASGIRRPSGARP